MDRPQEYRATARINFSFHADPKKATEVAQRRLIEILETESPDTFHLKIRKVKDNSRRVLGEFKPSDVLPFVTNSEERRKYVVDGIEYYVRMNSQRYYAFRASNKCVACGLKGTRMLLEQHPLDKSPHFNFYAVENEKLILMTKDHIRAKCAGGEDIASNFQTMCCICNNLKGSHNLTLESIRKLRHLYNINKGKMTRKKVNALINEERKKLIHPNKQDPKANGERLVARSDLAILRSKSGKLAAYSIYDIPKEKMTQVACVAKGSELPCVTMEDNRFFVEFTDELYTLYAGFVQLT